MSLRNLLSRFPGPARGPLMRPSGLPEANLGGIPDLVEPLLGWRVWRVWTPATGSDCCPVFSSVILDTPWAPRRRVSAEHSFDLGPSCRGLLESDCSCGLYAFKDPVEALGYLIKVRDRLLGMSVDVSFGTVSLWGTVVECERGYKAQYAYPHHFYLSAPISRSLAMVSSAFGVPVGIYTSDDDEEISMPVSFARSSRGSVPLKKSALIQSEKIPYLVGLYDLTASPEWVSQPLLGRPELLSSGLADD
ncbi:MAG: hypothetical protein P8Z30_01345 [Acidobacteriota bacterium]